MITGRQRAVIFALAAWLVPSQVKADPVNIIVTVRGQDGTGIRATVLFQRPNVPPVAQRTEGNGQTVFRSVICDDKSLVSIKYSGVFYSIPARYRQPLPCRLPKVSFFLEAISE